MKDLGEAKTKIRVKYPRNVSKAVKQLSDGQGFVMNMTPAREDRKAREACDLYFGPELVGRITSHLQRSTMNYEAIIDDLLEYDRAHVPKNKIVGESRVIYDMVIQSIKDDLGTPNLVPMEYEEIRSMPDFPGAKSPGLPYKNQGYTNKAQVFDDPACLEALKNTWRDVGHGKNVHLPDVCLFARAQIARHPKQKIRATWGYSFDIYMEEARYFYPIQNFIKQHKHNFPIAYGLEMANGGMSSINDMLMRNKGAKFIISDWSKFDKTVPVWLIRDAFDILFGLLHPNRVGVYTRRRWKKIVDYFCETPIRTCKGERFLVTGGVPSGSCFTNIVDSIINCIVTRFLSYQTTSEFPIGEIFLGDDGVFVMRKHACLEDFGSLALLYFGMILNVDKSYVTTNPSNVHFLGYFNLNGVPFKNQDYLIASFVYPEHRRTKLIDACAAALGQMYSGFDPYFARTWLKIIHYLADNERSDPFSMDEVVIHLRSQEHRHKYLSHVGIKGEHMTVPSLAQTFIHDVLPKPNCNINLPNRYYDYRKLCNST
ncbi:RNA-dependent RNA polymerase [Vespa velutina associated partiti-like virus 1]|nr:RNA-dependent RNA polymerase [Vespa velutina associated partiti-like virus 1]